MIVSRRAHLAAILVPLTALLVSCAAPAEPTATPTAPPPTSDSASALPTAGPLDPDVTLVVTATAKASNGAQLALELRVHQSTAWSDIAAETLPQAVADDCPETLTKALFATERWSFTRANLIALPAADSTVDWPASDRLGLVPAADSAAIAARGILADDDQAAGDVPSCKRDKFFAGVGTGGVAVGIPHDAVAEGEPGGYVKWTSHRFGFVTPHTGGSDATFTACSFTVLPLGNTFGANGAGWTQVNNPTQCSIGAP